MTFGEWGRWAACPSGWHRVNRTFAKKQVGNNFPVLRANASCPGNAAFPCSAACSGSIREVIPGPFLWGVPARRDGARPSTVSQG